MSTLCIHISRLDAGIYSWQLAAGTESLDSGLGESSICDCLKAASGGLPDEVKVVEITYRGLHMGTFRKYDVQEGTDDVADRISEMYGALVGS